MYNMYMYTMYMYNMYNSQLILNGNKNYDLFKH